MESWFTSATRAIWSNSTCLWVYRPAGV